ncbi:MAG: hypothetical protein JHD15_00310 [Phenylobacterium sp.]|uniref:hypothetical protein n=1 Tax=Phenylobacterium sp. TaxID=1871053 RepID=UPI001A201EB4|nr:hypothetical protein [Phenylobacterium sp.]MBJ7408799.1 hypothetical protein [Phenylobacterium sp.]
MAVVIFSFSAVAALAKVAAKAVEAETTAVANIICLRDGVMGAPALPRDAMRNDREVRIMPSAAGALYRV